MTFEQFQEVYIQDKSPQIRGSFFETLSRHMLERTDTENAFKKVDLWDDFLHKDGSDHGIDLVITKNNNSYIAVQCKYHKNEVRLAEAEKFTAPLQSGLSNGIKFSEGIFIAFNGVNEKTKRHFDTITDNNELPIRIISQDDFIAADIDWAELGAHNKIKIAQKSPKPHQQEAILRALEYFKDHDRGKMIMACGTGKTYTSLKIMEAMTKPRDCVLFLAPSLALIGQTFRSFEMDHDPSKPFKSCIICSDKSVGKDEDKFTDESVHASTDPKHLVQAYEEAQENHKLLVVFSTYQSSPVIQETCQQAGISFKLMICDEAHRTVPNTKDKQNTAWTICHEDSKIKANKRLYMTATPRTPKVKKGQVEDIISMDNRAQFGEEFYYLGFGEAIHSGLLTDYKVIILLSPQQEIADMVNAYNERHHASEKGASISKEEVSNEAISLEFGAKVVGVYKGLARQDLKMIGNVGTDSQDCLPSKQAVCFSTFCETSKKLESQFSPIIQLYQENSEETPLEVAIMHVDGTMRAKDRNAKIAWLKKVETGECKVLSNARCLSEGVDIPSLDTVVFFDSKESKIDIAQSIGRAIRTSEGKDTGYIIIPVVVESDTTDISNSIKGTSFGTAWDILRAMQNFDDRVIEDKVLLAMPNPQIKQSSEADKQALNLADQRSLFANLPECLEAIQAAIPEMTGSKFYWKRFGERASEKMLDIGTRIKSVATKDPKWLQDFLELLRTHIHQHIQENQALDMLAAHVILYPIYKACFGEFQEPIALGLEQKIQELNTRWGFQAETKDFLDYYKEVERQVKGAKSDTTRLKLLNSVHEAFVQGVYEKEKDKYGIVYTPLGVVDFILHSIQDLLQEHFKTDFNDSSVAVLDPFCGTGSFISALLNKENGLIDDAHFLQRAKEGIYAQEIMLLSYHSALLKISQTCQQRDPNFGLFKNVVLCDSLDYKEEAVYKKTQAGLLEAFRDAPTPLNENKKLKDKISQQKLTVICGNPPYSANQKDANDNNTKLPYPELEKALKKKYSGVGISNLGQTTRDSIIRALFMATERLGEKGVLGFVVNSGFLFSKSAAGVRRELYKDYNHFYILDLRGDLRNQRDKVKKNEGENIFDVQVGIAIIFGIKIPHCNTHAIHYYDIGDDLRAKDKLAFLTQHKSLSKIAFKEIIPNKEHDWLNQRQDDVCGGGGGGTTEILSA
ncbi:DEAD/DEAH box helicase family protein [Helicobacter vulpis]|uniref:DEAD/DEAH box helicase family protein n=1 Tax=Helicobacter vulpis TaxID=2316076 RepID=UPI0013CE3AB7|nr:DEAD/DEAH box helicase family protein [Helicobacter vulpis]